MAREWKLDALPIHPHPHVNLETYRLRVTGLVENPLELSIEDLLAMPQEEFVDDFTCLEGWVVPHLDWRGVRLENVLNLAGVEEAAAWVQASFEGFSVPLALDRAKTALLAMELNGGPIPAEHGAPVRLLVPGGECFTSVKWINHIELRDTPAAPTGEQIARARIASGTADTRPG